MTDHLSPLDATFLELEEADAGAHMHIGAVMVFEPAGDGAVPELAAVRADLEARLSAVPRFRQRLSAPATGGLTWPAWEQDPEFDIATHVRRAALPAPGGEAELMDWVGDFWSHRLDRRRPLWEMVLLEGLRDGRWALVSKTHHAMVDGVGSVDVGHVLLDAEPGPAPRPAQDGPAPAPATGHGPRLWGLPGAVARTTWAGLQAVLDPAALRDALHRSRALAELLARDELVAAPATSLNRPIGKARRFGVVRAPLEDLKLVKEELGGTINDVALAVGHAAACASSCCTAARRRRRPACARWCP